MHVNSYGESIDWLFQQFPSYQLIGSKAYKPTLENITKICQFIGNPEKQLRFIHIAGTNGKGSCSAMLASILKESGEKVGLFTSPHIKDFRERIRINGEMIAETDVVSFVEFICSQQLDFEPSFFEITFALALDHFRKSNCTICVIETGLGGRLDATNIIQPLACLITNISLEHTQILGDTLGEIAGEKAGIIKNNTPVLIGETVDETENVFREFAASKHAPIYLAKDLIAQEQLEKYQIPLLGSYQKLNLRSVLGVLDLVKAVFPAVHSQTIQRGLDNLHTNTGFFGRMQIMNRQPLVIFDVSHNYDGIKATLAHVQANLSGELYLLYGSSADKDVLPILALFPESAHLHLTTFNNQRSLNVDQLTNLLTQSAKKALIHTDPKLGLNHIRSLVKTEDTLLVFGSFFLLSDLIE
jgi:dihydrofolate synthase / folylpolyglutamate synthase